MAKFVSKKKKTIVAVQEIPTDVVVQSIPELNLVQFIPNPNGSMAFVIPKSLNINKSNCEKKDYPTGLESRTLELILPLNENDNVYIVNVHGYSFSKTSDDNNHDLFHDINNKYGSFERVILLGDFNTNPYEKNMIRSESILAYRDFVDVINAQKNVFYNPSWRYLKERKNFKGTFFYQGNTPKWNIYDQILISKKLVGEKSGPVSNRTYTNHVKLFHIPNCLGKLKFEPSKGYDEKNNISDHMPVLLTMEM